jgi:hypothetical protein
MARNGRPARRGDLPLLSSSPDDQPHLLDFLAPKLPNLPRLRTAGVLLLM